MYLDVHCGTIYNSQDMEATWMSVEDEWIKKLWYVCTMEYYTAKGRNEFESVELRWMNLDPVIHSDVSQKEKRILYVNTYIWNLEKQ